MACWIVTLQGGPKRTTQAAVALNDKIYAFGSCWCTEPAETFGVHVLNTIDYRWQRVPTRLFQPNPSQQFIDDSGQIYEPYGESPVHRVGHSVVEYKGKIYLWGGFCHEIGVLCSKMYCFDPEERTWSVIPCASGEATGREKHTAVGDIPRARMNHTACVIDDKMYVFGGVDFLHQELYLNVLDLRHCYWETPDVTGERPYGLVDACCWVYNKQMYIFAGCRHEDDQYIPGLFRYDPEISVWRKMHPFGLKGPSGRQRHCGVIVGDCAYVFCGLAQLISYNEMLGFGCLLEMCDLNVLNFNWKLKDLAAIAVLRYQLPRTSYNLPLELRIHLDMMTTPNHVL
ncbi:Kelch motif family protein [Brugia malayi]|uniref:Bm8431, isoform a n=1 Tax=Brugia malayi TaxID=6279 RepID=A0A0J9YBW0_BRUMA|nr:Kelch motif family protein [Brugia malayi]CDQ06683.1 Bm8431, isoform a [Brugia malayi]VIO94735.1 Kelch motif family protein [Brugia malayi]